MSTTTPQQGAQERVQEAAGQAQEKAQEAAGQAKSRAREQIDRRSTEAGVQVKTTADDLRSVGEQLRSQGKDAPARLADQAADRAQRLGGYLEDADSDRILRDVEDYARRQPWAVVAGGLALGFAAARFIKASSTHRYQQQYGGGSTGGARRQRAENGRTALPSEGVGAGGQRFADPGTGAAAVTTPTSGVVPPPGRQEP